MARLESILKYIVQTIFLLLMLMLLYLSCKSTVFIETGGDIIFNNDSLIKNIIIMAMLFAVGSIAYAALHDRLHYTIGRKMLIAASILNAALILAFVLATQYIPVSDELYIMNAAADLARGDNSQWLAGGYMFNYPFQNGIVLAVYLITLLFGESRYVLLQILNVVFMLVSLYALYRTLKLMRIGSNAAEWIYLLMPLWFPITMYVTFIYGNLVGLMFAMLAVMFMYQYFDSKKRRFMAASIVCIAVSAVLKSNYLITMIAMIIMLIYHSIHSRSWKPLINIIFVIAAYICLSSCVDYTVERLTGVETPDGIPMTAWAVMGITNDEGYGWFNGYNNYVYYKNGYDYSAAKEECNEYIRKRVELYIDKPRFAARYFKGKIKSIWAEPTFQCFDIQTTRETMISVPGFLKSCIYEGGTLNKLLLGLLDIMQTLIYAGAALYIMANWKKSDMYRLLFAIIFIGGFIFHFVWESKGQYTIIYFFLIIPYAIKGWGDTFVLAGSCISEFLKRRAYRRKF